MLTVERNQNVPICYSTVLDKVILQPQVVVEFCQLFGYEVSFVGTITVLLETQKLNEIKAKS